MFYKRRPWKKALNLRNVKSMAYDKAAKTITIEWIDSEVNTLKFNTASTTYVTFKEMLQAAEDNKKSNNCQCQK